MLQEFLAVFKRIVYSNVCNCTLCNVIIFIYAQFASVYSFHSLRIGIDVGLCENQSHYGAQAAPRTSMYVRTDIIDGCAVSRLVRLAPGESPPVWAGEEPWEVKHLDG